MFDYKRLENDLVDAMEQTLRTWAEAYDDLYILSLDCARDMTSVGIMANTEQYLEEQSDPDEEEYWYYKYCEAEWELFETKGLTEEISSYMNSYVEENTERFTDPETFEYLEAFDEHCEQMIATCENAVRRLRQRISQDFPDLLLAFSIGEYLDGEARAEFFASVNKKEASEEYAEHIEAFN